MSNTEAMESLYLEDLHDQDEGASRNGRSDVGA